jgi:hypothetical protein
MELYASKYIRFLYIITFLDSLLEGLQGFPTLKQFVSLNIGLKHIRSDYNQGHIIRELRTRDVHNNRPIFIAVIYFYDIVTWHIHIGQGLHQYRVKFTFCHSK